MKTVTSVTVTHSSLRKSKALLLSLGSCCRVLLFFLTDGCTWAVCALYLRLTGASPAGFLPAPAEELNRRLKLEVLKRGKKDGGGGAKGQGRRGRGMGKEGPREGDGVGQGEGRQRDREMGRERHTHRDKTYRGADTKQ